MQGLTGNTWRVTQHGAFPGPPWLDFTLKWRSLKYFGRFAGTNAVGISRRSREEENQVRNWFHVDLERCCRYWNDADWNRNRSRVLNACTPFGWMLANHVFVFSISSIYLFFYIWFGDFLKTWGVKGALSLEWADPCLIAQRADQSVIGGTADR